MGNWERGRGRPVECEDSVRLFVAIPVPEYLRQRLGELERAMRGFKWVRARNIHLTLKFLGATDPEEVDRMRESLRAIQVRPFLLEVSGLGVFPMRGKPAVLWAGLGSAHPHLFQLHKKVNDVLYGCGVEPDRRVYRPHITLARCKGAAPTAVRNYIKECGALKTAPFRVQKFGIYSSELGSRGPIYRRLESYDLNNGG